MGESELPNCKACRRTVMSASNRVPLEITMRSAPGAALWSCCRSVYDAPATLGEISGNFYGILSDKEKGDNRPEQMVICCPDGKPLTEATYTELSPPRRPFAAYCILCHKRTDLVLGGEQEAHR